MKCRAALALVVGAVAIASCGAGPVDDAGTERSGDLAGLTSTAAPSETTVPSDEIGCPNFLVDGEDRSKRSSFKETRLSNDAQRLARYGAAHQDVFGGLRVVHNPTRLEIGFTADIDEHCYLLRELTRRPNSFDLIRVEHSIADKLAAAGVAAEAGASTSAPGLGPVWVRLPAFAEGIAQGLHAAYGDMFEITLGGWPYPPPGEAPVEEACPPVVESEELPPLHVTVIPPSEPLNYLIDGRATIMGEVIAGEATLVIENRGTRGGSLWWGQQTTSLFAGGDDSQPVARYTGPRELWARSGQLAPGESVEMTAFIGLTPCSLDDGYMLPPGTYQLRGPLVFKWNDEEYVMLLDPVPVVVEETPPAALPPQEATTFTAPPTTLES